MAIMVKSKEEKKSITIMATKVSPSLSFFFQVISIVPNALTKVINRNKERPIPLKMDMASDNILLLTQPRRDRVAPTPIRFPARTHGCDALHRNPVNIDTGEGVIIQPRIKGINHHNAGTCLLRNQEIRLHFPAASKSICHCDTPYLMERKKVCGSILTVSVCVRQLLGIKEILISLHKEIVRRHGLGGDNPRNRGLTRTGQPTNQKQNLGVHSYLHNHHNLYAYGRNFFF